MKLRLVQWNIWYKEHAENIISFLRECGADIVCLQELTVGHELHNGEDIPRKIADALGYHYYFVPAHTFPTGYKIGNGIFSKYDLTNTQFYYVQHAHEGPVGAEEARAYVQADVVADGKTVTVATTHLSYSVTHEYSETRKREIEQLLSQLRTKQTKFIFTGDLNALSDSYTIQHILSCLKHAGPDFSQPTWPTKRFTPGPDVTDELKHRLDYVFVTPDVHVVSADIPLIGYSDHLPVVVEIEV